MARRNRDPEREAKREKMSNLLQELKVNSMEDIHDLFKEMIGTFLENGLEGELDEELGYTKYDYKNKATDNSRNGTSPKKVRSSYGEIDLNVPRDRKGEFEPELVKKQQTSISGDIEEKILSMYAKGMTTSDIEAHIRDIYGLSVSDSTISRITDKILPLVKEWQSRPLESVYAVVFMDAIHFHVRSEGQIIKKAVYIAIGINMEGTREVLGMWIGENESAKFWLSVLNGLKNRGLEDILIACVDGLSGFPSAIEAAYPKTEIQQCIIHQIRNSTKYCHRRTIIDPNRRKEIDPPRPYSYHWDCEDHQGGSENDKEWANTDDKTGSTIWSNSVRNREEIGHIQEHCEEIYQRCT